MPIVKIYALKCSRCGYVWFPRGSNRHPTVCAGCKSPYWDRPLKDRKKSLPHTPSLSHTLKPSSNLSSLKKDKEREERGLIKLSKNKDDGTWPEWYTILHGIPRFNYSLEHCSVWLDAHGINEDEANHAAYALKSKWDGKKYVDPWATFQNWAKNQQKRDNGNGDSPIEIIRQKHIREIEKRG